MAKNLIRSFTAETMRDLIQAAGFRAEIASAAASGPVIRSASNGLAFEIRLLNPLQMDANNFADTTFTAGLQLQGVLAPELVNRWNATKRFSRLYVSQGYLILALDIILQGGVTPEHLQAQIEIWDRLLQELLTYLRTATNESTPKSPAEMKNAAEMKGPMETKSVAMDKPAAAANGHAVPETAAPPAGGQTYVQAQIGNEKPSP
jgi:hypothetical protein